MNVSEEGLIDVEPAVIADWIAKGEALVVDVREEEEWEEMRIEGTVLSPMSDFEIEHFPKAKDGQRLVVICAKGGRSSAIGRKLLEESDMTVVYSMVGGVNGWAEADLPTVSGI